ncbi:hypothetical protein KAR34_05145 [bacterium]|nr:hypothetical protein [bacterium]
MIVELIFMFALGWGIAYFFFRREKKIQTALFEKLTHDARQFVLNDPREKLGLTNVIDLFREKIIAEHLDALDEPFPYKRCPHCGSKKVKRFVFKPDGTPDPSLAPDTPPFVGEDFKIQCQSCGYRDQATTPQESSGYSS